MTRTQTHQPVIATSTGVRLVDGGTIDSLAYGPITSLHADGDTLWALVGGSDVYRFAGGTSELIDRLAEPVGVVIGTHRGAVWVGGRQARVWRLDFDSVVEVMS